jgi:hypothetical protein
VDAASAYESLYEARCGRSLVFSLTYVSSAVKPFSKSELRELLAKSRKNNSRLDVTGMLLYKDGNFMQTLEGEEQLVLSLSERIHADARHKGMMVLHQARSPERQFADWSMGFCDLNSSDTERLPGYNDFMNLPLTDAQFARNPNRAMTLLLIFRKNVLFRAS